MIRKRKAEDNHSSNESKKCHNADVKCFKQSSSGHSGLKQEVCHILTDLSVERYVQSRAIEVQGLIEKLNDGGVSLQSSFQKLPRHMRRRAMSHNIKRIPRRLHNIAKYELQGRKTGKRPSRKYRRRPSNLLSDYERRKRRIAWLETHIWHAKRFKMIEKWGHRLAHHPNDKSVRACYRAVNTHCMMQDVSFESYIEIKGQRGAILSGLSHLTSIETGPTFAAKMTSAGAKEGTVTLYHFDSYPYGCIGQVTYLWNGNKSSQQQESTLWICCHPSFYHETLNELQKCFAVPTDPAENIDDVLTSNVSVSCLKDKLVKLRLYGPASNAILSEVLRPASYSSFAKANSTTQDDDSTKKPQADNLTSKQDEVMRDGEVWWKEYYKTKDAQDKHNKQIDVWSHICQCRSPAEAPPHCVIGLTVRDPRVLLPQKRSKVSTLNTGSVTANVPLDLITSEISSSPIWEEGVRLQVKTTKIPEKELNSLKSKQFVPGSSLDLGDKESRIPILLIQRPGAQNKSAYASGWDIVIPAGWSMAFWIALVYRGARVGGLREASSVSLQSERLSVPSDYPDSDAGLAELTSDLDNLRTKHERRPPAKRPNYVKLGIPHPFEFLAIPLVNTWRKKVVNFCQNISLNLEVNTPQNTMYVLRERKQLRLLDSMLHNPSKFLKLGSAVKDKHLSKKQVNKMNTIFDSLASHLVGKQIFKDNLSALVPVSFEMLVRGVSLFRGHLCIPSSEDLKNLDADKSYGGPSETLHKDPRLALRKAQRKERLKLKKKRQKDNKIKENNIKPDLTAAAAQALNWLNPASKATTATSTILKEPVEREQLEFDALAKTSRPIIGFIRNGNFDLSQGHGAGLAFCSVSGLLQLLEEQKSRTKTYVLLRNPTSLQFRFATLSISI